MKLSNISNNILNQIFSFGVRSFTDILIVILIARYSKIENLGLYSFAISFSLIARLILDMGIGMYLVREISKYKTSVRKYVGNTLSIFFLVSPLIFIISGLIIFYSVDDSIKVLAVLLTLLGFISVSFTSIFHSVFLAFSKLKHQSYSIVSQEFIYLISSFIILYNKLDFIYIFYAYFLARLISLIISIILFTRNIDKIEIEFDLIFIKKIVKECSPFFLNFILTAIYARGVIIFISYSLGDYSTGLYEVAFLISMKGIVCVQIFSKSIFPRLSELYKNRNELSFNQLSKNVLKVSYLLSFFLFIFIYFGAELIIDLFFDFNIYFESIQLTKILCVALFLKVFATSLTDILTTSFKQELRTKAVGFGAIISLLALFVLVPIFNLNGAVYSVVITEFTIVFFSLLYSSVYIRKLAIRLIFTNSIIIIIIIIIFNLIEIPYVLIIATSLVLFILLSSFFKSFTFKDLINLKNEI